MIEKNQYDNPVVMKRADPWIYKHTDGYYYFTGSLPGYQAIELRRAKKINDLQSNCEIITVWRAHEKGVMSELIWAPEIHFLKNKWYIYFAASNNSVKRDKENHHRMFVIENEYENPMNADWKEKGQIVTQFESFSLDGTVFEHNADLYYCWAQHDPRIPSNSNLYLSKMKNPWTLEGKQTLLSIPEYDWEKKGFSVNEGPAIIKRNDKIFITFSASATDENYCMGLLWADSSSDLLDGYTWNKLDCPVFSSSEKNKKFGPGHNSFTTTEDCKYDVLIYHARPEKNKKGDPLHNHNRHAMAQIFDWSEDGFPYFDKPFSNNKKIEE